MATTALILATLGCTLASTAEVKFDAERSFKDLKTQVSFGPRVPGSEGHAKCKEWLVSQMKESCEDVRLQEFEYKWQYGSKTLKMANVIGEQNYKTAKTKILLLAHWDTRPHASEEINSEKAQKPIDGANDGASGVAVLLELMRAVKGRLPKDVGIIYLLTDGEDLGPDLSEMFIGATHFAKNLPTPRPDYGILLDMIGDKDLKVPMEPNSHYYAPTLMSALYDHAAKIGLGSTFPKVYGPTISDDHLPINAVGIPTIDLIDFDYPYWHTLEDTVDKCSAESLGKVGKLMETWVLKEPSFKIK